MPHYADGTEAKNGDVVIGKTYNVPHEVQGVVVGVIPGTESCNVRVAFADYVGQTASTKTLDIKGYDADPNVSVPVYLNVDYGETKAFRKVK